MIGIVGMSVALITFLALIGKLCYQTHSNGGEYFTMDNGVQVLNYFIFGITVIVCAVPEGLPLAVTISLAYSVQKMYKEKNLVKKLHSSETMGGAHEICTDKTGTLTQNLMTVQTVYVAGNEHKGDKQEAIKNWEIVDLIRDAVVVNSSTKRIKNDKGVVECVGNPSEVAMFNYLVNSGVNVDETIARREDPQNIVFAIPFTSSRKRQTTVYRCADDENKVRVFIKGAPEIVLKYCSTYISSKDNQTGSLNETKRQEFLAMQKSFAE